MTSNRALGAAFVTTTGMACLLLVAAPARAAKADGATEVVHPIEIGVFGGIHWYNEDHGLSRIEGDSTGISPDTGGIFGLRLGYNFTGWLGAEGELALSPTRTRNDVTRDILLAYRAHLIATLPLAAHFKPFALLGYGALSAFPGRYHSDGWPDGDVGTETIPRSRDTDGFFHLGVGAKIPINDDFGLRLDGRVMAPGAIAADLVEIGTETAYGGPDYEVLLTAYLGFGGKKPVPPPPAPPPPAPVVEKDSDGDGLLDKNDKCPSAAEDHDGFQDEDGCPEPDNDLDGIADADDACPLEPETRNGFQDEDGCPDRTPIALVDDRILLAWPIDFAPGTFTLMKSGYEALQRLATFLNAHPELTSIRIDVHTDETGDGKGSDYAAVQKLTDLRAEAVFNALDELGVAAYRFTPKGFGATIPIAPNTTEEGRRLNNRVEFTVLERED